MATIIIRNGPDSSAATVPLNNAEPGFTTTAHQLWIGWGGTNYFIGGGFCLTALRALVPAADFLPYFTSLTASALTYLSPFSRTLLDDTTASAWRTTLGLGALAVLNSVDYSDLTGTPPAPPSHGHIISDIAVPFGAGDGYVIFVASSAWAVNTPDNAGLVDTSTTQAIAGAKTFEDVATFEDEVHCEDKVLVDGATTQNSIEAGFLGIGSYAVSNCWVSNNAYFDGTDWRRLDTGHAHQLYFLGTTLLLRVAGTDAAATVIVWKEPLHLEDSRMILGGTDYIISTDTADASDAKRLLIGGGGSVGANRGATCQLFGNEWSGGGVPGGSWIFDTGAAANAYIQLRTSDASGSGQTEAIFAKNGQVALGGTSTVTGAMLSVYGRIAGLAGGAAAWLTVGGTIYSTVTTVGNVGTGEDDLIAVTLPANLLNTNHDAVDFVVSLALSGTTGTRQVRTYFAGTLAYDSRAVTMAVTTTHAVVVMRVVRESSTVVRCHTACDHTIFTLDAAGYARITGLDLTTTNVIKITGETAGGAPATDDVQATAGRIEFLPAPA